MQSISPRLPLRPFMCVRLRSSRRMTSPDLLGHHAPSIAPILKFSVDLLCFTDHFVSQPACRFPGRLWLAKNLCGIGARPGLSLRWMDQFRLGLPETHLLPHYGSLAADAPTSTFLGRRPDRMADSSARYCAKRSFSAPSKTHRAHLRFFLKTGTTSGLHIAKWKKLVGDDGRSCGTRRARRCWIR